MTTIANMLREDENWIVLELNPERDMLQSLAAKLYRIPQLHPLFLKSKLDVSALGIGVSIEDAVPVTDIENALDLMLDQLHKTGIDSGSWTVTVLRNIPLGIAG